MDVISVDIFGACTVRDIFEICSLMKTKYRVNKFIQNNTPLTIGYDTLSTTTMLKFTYKDFQNTPKC